MKPTKLMNGAFLVMAMTLSQYTFAYEREEPVACRPPKMLEFSLPEYSQAEKFEVPPESEFSFKLSGGTPAEKIQVFAKEKVLDVEMKPNTSFTLIKGKVPAEFTGKFLRLNVIVHTELGCISRDGWLLKVADQK